MDRSKLLTFLISFMLLGIFHSNAQKSQQSNCDHISFETKVTPSSKDRENASIQFHNVNDDKTRYKIFLLNKGSDLARKELSDRSLTNLAPGTYEFIIIDTQVKGCFKEVVVRIPALN